MNTKYYKHYVQKLIDANPSVIKIRRFVDIPDGYGGHTEEEIEVAETVTFYERNSRREVVSEYGTTYTGVSVSKILAHADADIEEGDEFKAHNKNYRVAFAKKYADICVQAELELIK